MADTSQGDGWWIASDGKWYPPQLHADEEHRDQHAAAPPAPPQASPQGSGDHADVGGTRSKVWLWLAGAVVAAGVLVPVLVLTLGSDSETDAETTGSEATAEPDDATTDPVGADPAPEDPDEEFDPVDAVDDTLDTPTGGSAEDPVGFGQTFQWEQWQAAVVEVIDPNEEGLLAEFSEAPDTGNVFVAVIYDVTYLGTDIGTSIPIFLDVTSTTTVDSFGCFLDEAALEERGLEAFVFELVPGQTAHTAECFEVPADEVSTVSITLENFDDFGPAVVFSEDGRTLPDPGPVTAAPDYDNLDTLSFGSPVEWEEWSGTITGLIDAKQAGLLNTFAAEPQEGFSYIAVAYDVTYSGTNETEFNPLLIAAMGSAVFDSFGACFLSPDRLVGLGIESLFELEPNQTASLAACVEIPDAELDSVFLRLSNPFEFQTEPFYYHQN